MTSVVDANHTDAAELARLGLRESIRMQQVDGELPPVDSTHHPARRTAMSSSDTRRVKFDPTINLGHVLTFVGLIATGFGAYSLMDRRVAVLEERSLRSAVDYNEARREMREATSELRADIKEVQRTVTDLVRYLRPDRLDRTDRK